jgi:dienelactone hydrolase
MADDPLDDFDTTTFAAFGAERRLDRIGVGPAVIVIPELPGLTPRVADLARRVAGIGCTAVVPTLFGRPGHDPLERGRLGVMGALARSAVPACVSREFTVWATGRSSPIVEWLRELARHEHQRCGGPGVGVVGMCFTGGFALAMATDPAVVAPVMSQPSLPFGVGRRRRHAVDCSPGELRAVTDRCDAGELEVLGLRFCGDRLVPHERFAFLREQLGDAFVAIELDAASANPASPMPPHSVLTEHLVDSPGEPTRAALDEVLDFLRARLARSGPDNP